MTNILTLTVCISGDAMWGRKLTVGSQRRRRPDHFMLQLASTLVTRLEGGDDGGGGGWSRSHLTVRDWWGLRPSGWLSTAVQPGHSTTAPPLSPSQPHTASPHQAASPPGPLWWGWWWWWWWCWWWWCLSCSDQGRDQELYSQSLLTVQFSILHCQQKTRWLSRGPGRTLQTISSL